MSVSTTNCINVMNLNINMYLLIIIMLVSHTYTIAGCASIKTEVLERKFTTIKMNVKLRVQNIC